MAVVRARRAQLRVFVGVSMIVLLEGADALRKSERRDEGGGVLITLLRV